MNITPIKTPKLTVGVADLYEVLDDALPDLYDSDIVAITSKVVSICEGAVVPLAGTDKEALIIQESDKYLPSKLSKYGHHFTVTNHTLISVAGIDESNGDDYYILWPRDAQKTANDIRKYLAKKHGLTRLGVIITDSTCQPLRRGTTGIDLAHSGFLALKNYVGSPDLFGRPLAVTYANIACGIAAAAVLVMGEGAEQTPLCIVSDVPAIVFQERDPSLQELAEKTISLNEDLFEPFLSAVPWRDGKRGTTRT
jgi:putative folate metabolism gamma-glutamate ligase